MRFGILNGLALLNDTASKTTILDLFEKQVPLTTDQNQIWDLLGYLKERPEYANTMVPDILKYTNFREFEYPIYDFVGHLVDSGWVEGERYASYKDRMLRDAKRKLRMHQASQKEAEEKVSLSINGNNYSYSKQQNEQLTQSEEIVLDFASILAPFHGADEKVKRFFEDLQGTSSDPLLFHGSLLMVNHGIEVADTVWEHFASKDPYRKKLYKRLKEMKKTEKFPESHMDQRKIVRSHLYDHIGLSKGEDSLEFLERRKVRVGEKEGYVHFFRLKRSYSDQWKLSYTGLQPLEEGKVELEPSFTVRSQGVLNERRDLSEFLKETVKTIELRGRERTSSSTSRRSIY